jgi:hypothetical protein
MLWCADLGFVRLVIKVHWRWHWRWSSVSVGTGLGGETRGGWAGLGDWLGGELGQGGQGGLGWVKLW